MKSSAVVTAIALASSVLGAPSGELSSLKSRATTFCGQFDTTTEGSYTIYNNLWGEASATSGSQCTTVSSFSGTTVAWSTSWSWAGGAGSVKSYANVALPNINKELSTSPTISTTWKWSYTGSNIVADVSYDTWLAPTSGGTNDYEIMIWLAALGGAGPISATGSPVSTPVINGVTWNLFKGTNGDTTVLSFVAQSEQTSFSANLMLFYTYLIENEGVPSTHFLTEVQAGTEPFSGSSAVLTTSAFSVTA